MQTGGFQVYDVNPNNLWPFVMTFAGPVELL